MNRHEKASGHGWAWVVLGLCALATVAGAFRASRMAQSLTEKPQAETPRIIAETPETPSAKPSETEEVSLPVSIPALPETPETPAEPDPLPEEPVTAQEPQVVVRPLEGEAVAAFSADALQYNETLADWRTHEGLDIAAAEGTDVLAACAGTVVSVSVNDLLGSTVVLDHGNGRKTVYASLQPETTVKAGDSVRAGQVLGTVGNSSLTESALGPHLHFAVLQDEEPQDPAEFLGD